MRCLKCGAVATGHKLRHISAPALIGTLDRGPADNSVGQVIELVLRADLILIDEIGLRQ